MLSLKEKASPKTLNLMLIAHWGQGASHGGRGKNGIITDMVKITMYQVSVGTLIIM